MFWRLQHKRCLCRSLIEACYVMELKHAHVEMDGLVQLAQKSAHLVIFAWKAVLRSVVQQELFRPVLACLCFQVVFYVQEAPIHQRSPPHLQQHVSRARQVHFNPWKARTWKNAFNVIQEHFKLALAWTRRQLVDCAVLESILLGTVLLIRAAVCHARQERTRLDQE